MLRVFHIMEIFLWEVVVLLERKEAAMPHSNGIITAPIGIDSDIPQVLGLSSTDIGYLCSNEHGKINIWSLYKPIDNPSLAELPDDTFIAARSSGWVIEGPFKYGIFVYHVLKYKKPTVFRSTDFNRYNHYAPALKLTIDKFIDASSGTEYNSHVASGGEVTQAKLNITYPEIPFSAFPNSNQGQQGDLEIIMFYGNDRYSIYKKSIGVLTLAEWKSKYSGKTEKISVNQTVGYPDAGQSRSFTYYLVINGCHMLGFNNISVVNKMYKQFRQDPSDPSQWLDVQTIEAKFDTGSTDTKMYLRYTSVKYIKGNGKDATAISIENLWYGTPFYISIYVKLSGNANYVKYAEYNSKNIEGQETTYFNGSSSYWHGTYTTTYTYPDISSSPLKVGFICFKMPTSTNTYVEGVRFILETRVS